MKKTYTSPICDIIVLNTKDIITTSGDDLEINGGKTPVDLPEVDGLN